MSIPVVYLLLDNTIKAIMQILRLTTITIAVLFCSMSTNGQTPWPDPSAKWVYGSNYWNYAGYNLMTYSGKCQNGTSNEFTVDSYFISNEEDTSIYNVNTVCFVQRDGIVYSIIDNPGYGDTLYNFNAVVGDYWSITGHYETEIHVEEIGTIDINGHDLKFQKVRVDIEYNENTISSTDTIVERIGFLNRYFIPYDYIQTAFDANEGGPPFCYYDDTIGYYSKTGIHCNVLENIVPTREEKISPISIFPNPASTDIFFEGVTPDKVLLIGINGNRKELELANNRIDISQLNSGMHFLQLRLDEKDTVFKFIKI